MKIENLVEKFRVESGIDLEKDTDDYRALWGNVFSMDITGLPIETFEQRVALIDKATMIEHERLINDEDSWANHGLNIIGKNWKAFSFYYGTEMLFDTMCYDLAYSNSQWLPLDIAQKFYDLIMADYNEKDTFVYCNYSNSPWDKELSGYGGWQLTDDWTFDLAVVLVNASKLTFCYFLSED